MKTGTDLKLDLSPTVRKYLRGFKDELWECVLACLDRRLRHVGLADPTLKELQESIGEGVAMYEKDMTMIPAEDLQKAQESAQAEFLAGNCLTPQEIIHDLQGANPP